MPSAVPQLYQYDHVPETKEDLDWAECKSTVSTHTHDYTHEYTS